MNTTSSPATSEDPTTTTPPDTSTFSPAIPTSPPPPEPPSTTPSPTFSITHPPPCPPHLIAPRIASAASLPWALLYEQHQTSLQTEWKKDREQRETMALVDSMLAEEDMKIGRNKTWMLYEAVMKKLQGEVERREEMYEEMGTHGMGGLGRRVGRLVRRKMWAGMG